MDKTLREYLQQADDAHEYLEKFFIVMNINQIEDKVLEIQSSIKTLQSVAYQLANISNIMNRALLIKKKYKNDGWR